ncbi:ZYRO0D12056p [Zygosaccharomyces rouxii]|uniref:Phosphoribosylglycinamide formyltransferase n=1 Tax=Zygosaccharomyces rouxii (strain ATCC 2623 / CBS 732 / NBRC 1130 / NCYC 568 / NRRL Y-229) TaxID=559307 RepID=C5DW56_ZYGRC|nr:uncharacterized protein ZYRO0D12056g [Zygosaccharomyces rouxii]KAH9200935.1 formyl transferase [Zygosaccharomyces rouxii]CAR28025.1 ZYRO0D12056p [Zygosaccharomyces rouxii]
MGRITVLISGSGSNLQSLIDAQAQKELGEGQITCVISSSKKAYGLQRAEMANIPTKVCSLYPFVKDVPKSDEVGRQKCRVQFEEELARQVLEQKPDLVVCAGWLLILGPHFLSKLRGIPIINLHPALPGAFDGTTHAIEMAWQKAQDTGNSLTAGCMVHYVIEEVDRGEPLIIKELEIRPGQETLEQYEQRVHEAEHVAIVEATVKVLKKR